MTVILIAGDTHGHFDLLGEHINAAARTHGAIDAVVAVGDFLTGGEGTQLPQPAPSFGAPVWFIGGNHEPWLALDGLGPAELAPGLTYLGRAGTCQIAGLSVAFLSGAYGPRVSEGPALARDTFKDKTCWVREELDHLAEIAGTTSVDLLVTHEWPAGFAADRYGVPVGSSDIARLSARLEPRLHVCGHLHLRRSGFLGAVRVEVAGYVPDGVTGSFVTRWDGGEGVEVADAWPDSQIPEAFALRIRALKGKAARRYAARTSRVPVA